CVRAHRAGEHSSVANRLVVSLMLVATSIPLFAISIFTKNRANIGLILIELAEGALLDTAIVRMRFLRKVVVFSAYEKDTAFLSCYLIDVRKLEVQLVPSSNPLKNFYRSGVCSTFTFPQPSQKVEMKK